MFDHWQSTLWDTVRNRREILTERKSVLVDGERVEVHRGSFDVGKCAALQTYNVLASVEYQKMVDESFVGERILHQFDADRCTK